MSLLTLLPSADAVKGRRALTADLDPRFVVADHEPVYLHTQRAGELDAKLEQALSELEHCRACPRDCGVDRTAGELGTCNTGRRAYVAKCIPSLW